MLRILIFGLSTGMGGVETYLMNLYRNIDRSNIQFDFVVAGKECYYANEIEDLGGEIYYITPKKENVFLNIVDLIKVLNKSKKTHKVVYFNLSALYYNLPYIFSTLYKFPVIIAHGHSAGEKKKKKNLRYYLHILNRVYVQYASDHLFACSKSAGEWVFGKPALEKNKVKIIPNAIPIKEYKYKDEIRALIRKELGIRDNIFVVGHVGRLSYVKNQMYLLDIFQKIEEGNENSVLLLVGEGESRAEIEDKVSKLGLENKVIITGSRTDVPRLLQAMDAFVLPSRHEGLPFVLIEAQATGLNCFVSKDVVTEESNITGLINFIKLNEKPNYWTKQIFKHSKENIRQDMTEKIKHAGFDIEKTAIEFEKFILNNEI
ncbi:glycosyltransferase [Falsibacillus pallidus]|uniref:glycosyltransferase n=1 Tax=Falsibacillus pallidus TaxID=493781 RepID=UPI003D961EAD